jgi:hypothetical protein
MKRIICIIGVLCLSVVALSVMATGEASAQVETKYFGVHPGPSDFAMRVGPYPYYVYGQRGLPGVSMKAGGGGVGANLGVLGLGVGAGVTRRHGSGVGVGAFGRGLHIGISPSGRPGLTWY